MPGFNPTILAIWTKHPKEARRSAWRIFDNDIRCRKPSRKGGAGRSKPDRDATVWVQKLLRRQRKLHANVSRQRTNRMNALGMAHSRRKQ